MLRFTAHIFFACIANILLPVQVIQCLNLDEDEIAIQTVVQDANQQTEQALSELDEALNSLSKLPKKRAQQQFEYYQYEKKIACYRRVQSKPAWWQFNKDIIEPIIFAILPNTIPPYTKHDWREEFDGIQNESTLKVLGVLAADRKSIVKPNVDITKGNIGIVLSFGLVNLPLEDDKPVVQQDYFIAGLLKDTGVSGERKAFILRSFLSDDIKDTVITVAPSWTSLVHQMHFEEVVDTVKYSDWGKQKIEKINELLMPQGISEEEKLSNKNYENLRKYLASCKIAQCTYL